MPRNAENHQRIHLTPFRGVDQNSDEQDVPDGYFVDGENLVCTEKPGAVISRPGYNHWKVDENGYGVQFPQPIAILPGSGLVGGVLTPPTAVPATPNPENLVPIASDPPIIPDNGPTTPVEVPIDPPTPTKKKKKDPPVFGSIELAASPVSGNVATGTDLTINFYVNYNNLPDGVTIATHSWDYLTDGNVFTSDGTTASTKSDHVYSTDDFSVYENNFYAAVRATGSDAITYSDVVGLSIFDDDETEATAKIAFTAPALDAILSEGEAFTITVEHSVFNEDTSVYDLTNTSLDVICSQVTGASLMDSGGGELNNDERTIEFTDASSGSQSFQVALSDDDDVGTITIKAVQEESGLTIQDVWAVSKKRVLAEIVNSAGAEITTLAWTSFDAIFEEWTFYIKVTAQDCGVTDTAFNSDVKLTLNFAKPSAGYGIEWDNAEVFAQIVGVDENAIYAAGTAVALDELNVVTIPRSYFQAGDAGQASVKVTGVFYRHNYSYGPGQDSNSGVTDMTVTAEVV